MKFNNIIEKIGAVTPEQLGEKVERRNVLKGVGTQLAMAAVPFALASLFSNKAGAQSKETINNVLNYLLKYEQVMDKVLTDAIAADGLIPGTYKAQFELMLNNTKANNIILQDLIVELGGVPVLIDPADVDTGGRGGFIDAMSNTTDFLIMAQYLCDAGTRIYNGQILEVLSDKITVRALTCIHSVKARNAAFVRMVRRVTSNVDVRPWITGTNTDSDNPSAQRAYSGEGNTIHVGIQTVGINGYDIRTDAATQAFDEPLNMTDGNNIVNRFIKA